MHKGMGLDVFNEMPMRRAVHAVYECCHSVPLAADIARARPYADHDALFKQAEQLLFEAYPDVDPTRGATRDELARINRARLELMLGPEGGYDNWC